MTESMTPFDWPFSYPSQCMPVLSPNVPHDHPRLRHPRRQAAHELGVMHGSAQAQGHAQVMVRFADYRENPQAASDASRWRIDTGFDVNVEPGMAPEVIDELRRRAHTRL